MKVRWMLVRAIKAVHTLSAIGLMGAVAACVVLRFRGPAVAGPGYVEVCHAIDQLYVWLIFPSTLVCIASGFASMVSHKPYWNALWAWAKGASGLAVMNFAFRMQNVALEVATPQSLADRAELDRLLATEWSGLWVLLALSLFNVVVGIWRPRFQGM